MRHITADSESITLMLSSFENSHEGIETVRKGVRSRHRKDVKFDLSEAESAWQALVCDCGSYELRSTMSPSVIAYIIEIDQCAHVIGPATVNIYKFPTFLRLSHSAFAMRLLCVALTASNKAVVHLGNPPQS